MGEEVDFVGSEGRNECGEKGERGRYRKQMEKERRAGRGGGVNESK